MWRGAWKLTNWKEIIFGVPGISTTPDAVIYDVWTAVIGFLLDPTELRGDPSLHQAFRKDGEGPTVRINNLK